ncbi:MAG: hypothetical protein IPF46_02765 [Saprospiraceae bacterium]|nr:hypothetical protein [Candidatus Vicinibacter affinis]HQX45089.1 hypothetical protein [Saprospiraceae bacterium]MBK6572634.1 hypothetical protein [Candidatus Vicinibacter affinis]MBK7302999.1 hypothetical protein [Candidatus Vicinibacter affinis]MBK7696184.1 hypothetical protein [Candidatus Vicinibacter affinis]
MNNPLYKFIFPLFLLAYTLQACVDNEYTCPRNTPTLIFHGYPSTDVDSIVFNGFTKGSGFQKLEKKFSSLNKEVSSYRNHDTLYVEFYEYPMSDSLDWEIKLIPVSQSFLFTDIKYHKSTCGCKGLLAWDCYNFGNSLFSEANIDGITYQWKNQPIDYKISLYRK